MTEQQLRVMFAEKREMEVDMVSIFGVLYRNADGRLEKAGIVINMIYSVTVDAFCASVLYVLGKITAWRE